MLRCAPKRLPCDWTRSKRGQRVILSEAKDLGADSASGCRAEILRFAQDDREAFPGQSAGNAGEMLSMTMGASPTGCYG